VWPGVFVVGRPELTDEGRWMAAVLTCGPGAFLSHVSAGELWGLVRARPGPVTVSVPAVRRPRRGPGLEVHRRSALAENDVAVHRGIPVTTPAATLIDLAALIDPETLRTSLDDAVRRPGTAALRRSLDRATATLRALPR